MTPFEDNAMSCEPSDIFKKNVVLLIANGYHGKAKPPNLRYNS